MSLLGGFSKPLGRFLFIPRDTLAFEITETKMELGIRISLLSNLGEPLDRFITAYAQKRNSSRTDKTDKHTPFHGTSPVFFPQGRFQTLETSNKTAQTTGYPPWRV